MDRPTTLTLPATVRSVVLVEGASDRVALETLAARRGRDLDDEGVRVVAMGGATAIGPFLRGLTARRPDVTVTGLCDAGEVHAFRRALERAGHGTGLTRDDIAALGFFVCDADLEDELIRALGTERVEGLLAAEGDLRSFRTFQRQPAQRHRTDDQRLRRFLGTTSGRKIHYARVLVDALDLDAVPRPLDGVLAHV